MHITSRNTNTLQNVVYDLIQKHGINDVSRNGNVLRFPEPVMITLTHPWERVNVCPIRDANPFFHIIESAAILAGVNDTPFLAHFASNMINFSDDGLTQNAFYGTRLLQTWGNQINQIIVNLMENQNSRQEVALIWNPEDLTKTTKDKACNVMLMFSIDATPDGGAVTMTSINRSNDAIWGFVTGANVVHLSYIHEYVACSLGRRMGKWHHFSNNLHVYTDNPKWAALWKCTPFTDYYELAVGPRPLFTEPDQKRVFDEQLSAVLEVMVNTAYKNGFSVEVSHCNLHFITDIIGMFNAWQMHKSKVNPFDIHRHINLHVRDGAWRLAAMNWIYRHSKPATT